MATQPTFEFNESKFRNLLLHLSTLCEDDPRFGATKLNKLLYYIDFGAYRLLGQPVTGATYQNLPEGPAPRELVAVRDALIKEGAAAMEVRPYFIRDAGAPRRQGRTGLGRILFGRADSH
jgi:hypothetical protein